MTALLLRLAAPMQSWGERGQFGERHTADFPTRSGLLGFLACAHGIPRGDHLGDLTEMDFIVRIDRPGVRMIDFHTVGGRYPGGRGMPTADGSRRHDAIITRRHYLADAVFTIACTGPTNVVASAHKALQDPHWQPYLGRRSCPPEEPVVLGTTDDPDLALRTAPLPPRAPRHQGASHIDFVRTAAPGEPMAWSEILDDTTSFPTGDRHYRPRPIHRSTEYLPDAPTNYRTIDYLDTLVAFMKRSRV